jgi:lipoprotein-releasing system permease protein
VRLEKAMMFVILTLIVAVAAFNIVSGQMMLVNEKRSDLAILQTMGARPRLVLSIFLVQGLAVAFMGIMLGICLGLIFAFNIADWVSYVESSTSVRLLEGTYFSRLPVQVEFLDLVFITAISGVICLFAAILPARRALAANPIAALHGL